MEETPSKLDLLTLGAAVYLGSYLVIDFVVLQVVPTPLNFLEESLVALVLAGVIAALYVYRAVD